MDFSFCGSEVGGNLVRSPGFFTVPAHLHLAVSPSPLLFVLLDSFLSLCGRFCET